MAPRMAGHFGLGGSYSFFDEKFDDNSTSISATERTWMLKSGQNTFWGSRMNTHMPSPGLLKGQKARVAVGESSFILLTPPLHPY